MLVLREDFKWAMAASIRSWKLSSVRNLAAVHRFGDRDNFQCMAAAISNRCRRLCTSVTLAHHSFFVVRRGVFSSSATFWATPCPDAHTYHEGGVVALHGCDPFRFDEQCELVQPGWLSWFSCTGGFELFHSASSSLPRCGPTISCHSL